MWLSVIDCDSAAILKYADRDSPQPDTSGLAMSQRLTEAARRFLRAWAKADRRLSDRLLSLLIQSSALLAGSKLLDILVPVSIS